MTLVGNGRQNSSRLMVTYELKDGLSTTQHVGTSRRDDGIGQGQHVAQIPRKPVPVEYIRL